MPKQPTRRSTRRTLDMNPEPQDGDSATESDCSADQAALKAEFKLARVMNEIAEAMRKEELEAAEKKERKEAEEKKRAIAKELEKEIKLQMERSKQKALEKKRAKASAAAKQKKKEEQKEKEESKEKVSEAEKEEEKKKAEEKAKAKGKGVKHYEPKKKKEFDPSRLPRSGGPVIKTPPQSKAGSPGSSSSTSSSSIGGNLRLPEEYKKYPAGPSECWEERAVQFDDPKLEANLKKRKEGAKKCSSGYTLSIKALEKLGVREEFMEHLELTGLNWLARLEPRTVPICLCEEFFTSFNFEQTSDVGKVSIKFRLFNAYYEMNIHEWSVRLGLYGIEDIVSGLVEELQLGIPTDEFGQGVDELWGFLSDSDQSYHYSRVFAYQIVDPVLRLCHVFLVTNLLGASTAYSKIPAAALFFLWCIVHKRKIHLGFWLAHSIHTISHSPTRHLTLCHVLAQFIHRNFAFEEPESLAASPQTPPPHQFDLEFMRNAGIIRIEKEVPTFYQPGEDPNSILSRSDPEVERAKERMNKRVKTLERTVEKLAEAHVIQSAAHTKAMREQTTEIQKIESNLAKLVEKLSELTKERKQEDPPKQPEVNASFDDDKEDEPPVDKSGDAPPDPAEKKKRAPRNSRGR